jgi:serine/threonine-protein kinase
MAAVPLDVFAAEFGPLAPERALGILRGIAEQLDRLAEFGGFHGALTPAAILVTEAGEVQLLPPQPLPEVVAESYTAPELRRRGTAVDGRADQYGLALIAWELLAAQPRVTRDEATGVAVIHQVNVTPGHVLRPGLSRHIGAVLHDALNRDPAGRYPSAGAFVDALAIAIDDRPAPSSFRPPDAPDGPRQVTNRRREKRSYDPTSGSRLVTATGLAAAVAAVAAITWLVGGGGGGLRPGG